MGQRRNRVNHQNDDDSSKFIEEEMGIKMVHEQVIESYSNLGTDSHRKKIRPKGEE